MTPPMTYRPQASVTEYRDPQEGNYLTASWGYDQTNATFWKVLKRTPQQVVVVEVEPRQWIGPDGETTRLAPTDTPVRDHSRDACELPWTEYNATGTEQIQWRQYHHENETPPPCMVPRVTRRKVQPSGYVRMTSYMGAHVYEGGGVYDTIAAGEPGH